jgi:molybdopterin molybdotransferase
MMRLTALGDLLPPLLGAIKPLAPVAVRLEQVEGMRLAADLVAPVASPAEPVALRAGLAVAALDLVGASPHSPVLLARVPHFVQVGDALPPGCDAVIDPSAVSEIGHLVEATEAAEPGAHVRLEGHDLGVDHVIARRGERITPEIILAAELVGLANAEVRIPTARIAMPASLEADWLRRRLRALGVVERSGEGRADIVFSPAGGAVPRIALKPGECAFARLASDEAISIELPERFDAMFGAWCAVALPVIARLTGLQPAVRRLELARKVTSTVGLVEVALLKREAGKALPLAVGDITLAAIATADAFAILPAGSEGMAAGSLIDAMALDSPHGPERLLS